MVAARAEHFVNTMVPTPDGGSRLRSGVVWGLLGLILLLAAGLRIHDLNRRSLWTDEFFALRHSAGRGFVHERLPVGVIIPAVEDAAGLAGAGPWWSAWRSVRDDVHPPLHFILLRFWREVFGDSEVAVRSLSVAASLVGIALLFLLGRMLFGTGAGLWAALLMAVAAQQIYHAQQARGYTLLTALGLGACLALVRMQRLGPGFWRAVALFGCTLGAMMTHYFALGALAGLGIYAVLRLRGASRRQAMMCFAAAALVFLVAWGPSLWSQRQSAYTAGFLEDEPAGHLWRVAKWVAGLPARYFYEPLSGSRTAASCAAVLYVLPFLMARRRPDLLLPGLWLVGTVAVSAGMDLTRCTWQLNVVRYTVVAAPAVYLLVAGLLADQRWLFRPVLPAMAAIACVMAIPMMYGGFQDDLRQMAQYLDRQVGPDDTIIFAKGDMPAWFAPNLLVNLSHYTPVTRRQTIILREPATEQLLRPLLHGGRVWLVSAGQGTGTGVVPHAEVLTSTSFPLLAVVHELKLGREESPIIAP